MNAAMRVKTIPEARLDRSLDTLANVVMNDPNHKARVMARAERERKAYYSAVEKERADLQKKQAELEKQRKKEQRAYEIKLSHMATDFEAAKATLIVGCLMIGYILSYVW